MTSYDFDICVAGAGMAGRMAALALAEAGFSVLLADPAPAGTAKRDGRTTALAYACVRALRRVGAWEGLEARACPVTDIVVANGEAQDRFRAGRVRSGVLHFPSDLLPEEDVWEGTPLAHIVENADLASALSQACAEAEGMTERSGAGVTETEADTGGVSLAFSDESRIRARLLVACDGRGSPLRRKAGLRVIERPYAQDAITFVVGHTEPHGNVARQAFFPNGPFAALPLTGGRSSIVWTERADRSGAIAALSKDDLLKAVQGRLGDGLGTLSIETAPLRYPLSFLFAPGMTAERMALVGDAAHVIHPIAGQGFNLAIKDAAALAEVLSEARQTGLDIGHGTVLSRYDQWRRADTAAMAFGTDALARGLSSGERVMRTAAGIGFGLVQRSETLRGLFARQAGGDTGRLPRLLQREGWV